MHRDQKIGLSLAVLIIGFAGAFCLRVEPMTGPHPLALEQASALDERIEQLPIRAYTQREGVRGILAPPERLDAAADVIDARLIERPALPLEPGPQGSELIELFRAPPDPVRPAEAVVAVETEKSPASSKQWSRGPSRYVAPATPGDAVTPLPDVVRSPPAGGLPAAVEPPTYVVKSGDTLSGIAVQMYGSSRRYLELYRANRDVLSDPNDLPVGTTLRIP